MGNNAYLILKVKVYNITIGGTNVMINKKIKYFIMSFMLIMVCILSINISGISVNAKDNLSDVSSFQIILKMI